MQGGSGISRCGGQREACGEQSRHAACKGRTTIIGIVCAAGNVLLQRGDGVQLEQVCSGGKYIQAGCEELRRVVAGIVGKAVVISVYTAADYISARNKKCAGVVRCRD